MRNKLFYFYNIILNNIYLIIKIFYRLNDGTQHVVELEEF